MKEEVAIYARRRTKRAIDQLWAIGTDDTLDAAMRVKALKAILNRAIGRAPDVITLKCDEEPPTPVPVQTGDHRGAR